MKNLIIKTIMIVAFISLVSLSIKAQNATLMVVNSAFHAQYAGARLKKWTMRGDTCVAVFSKNHRNYMAYYSIDGNWYKSEGNMVNKSNLPIAAQSFLKHSKYASWNIDGLKKITMPQHTMYAVQIDNHSGSLNDYENAGSAVNKTLYFNGHGQLVSAN